MSDLRVKRAAITLEGSAPPIWLPTDIGGCKRWGRSDLGITKDGSDRIDTYADQSGTAGSDYTQATDAKKPLFVANQIDGQASIRFDAIDDYMSCAGAGLVAAFAGDDLPVTVFWVSRKTASGGDVYPWCAANTGGVAPFFGAWDYGSFAVRRRGNSQDLVGVYDGAFDANWNYWVMNFHGTTISLRKNGVTVIDNEAMHTTSVDGINIVILGARDEGVTGICDVEFAEDGVYDNDISADNVILLETYLAARYPSI